MSGQRELLRLFPLSSAVLFPGVPAPLRVFEPRYLQMTADALAGDRLVGMATVRPESVDRMAGDPPLCSVGCAGVIRWSELRPDGEYEIVLLGTSRFRIMREPSRPDAQLFRSAEVEWLDDPLEPGDGARIAALRAAVLDRIRVLGAYRGGGIGELANLGGRLLEGADDRRFVNLLAQILPFRPEEKQALLESHGIRERAECLLRCVQTRVEERVHRGGASHSVH